MTFNPMSYIVDGVRRALPGDLPQNAAISSGEWFDLQIVLAFMIFSLFWATLTINKSR
jgi:ABC-type polysaccharide/polyol phosphate export permease